MNRTALFIAARLSLVLSLAFPNNALAADPIKATVEIHLVTADGRSVHLLNPRSGSEVDCQPVLDWETLRPTEGGVYPNGPVNWCAAPLWASVQGATVKFWPQHDIVREGRSFTELDAQNIRELTDTVTLKVIPGQGTMVLTTGIVGRTAYFGELDTSTLKPGKIDMRTVTMTPLPTIEVVGMGLAQHVKVVVPQTEGATTVRGGTIKATGDVTIGGGGATLTDANIDVDGDVVVGTPSRVVWQTSRSAMAKSEAAPYAELFPHKTVHGAFPATGYAIVTPGTYRVNDLTAPAGASVYRKVGDTVVVHQWHDDITVKAGDKVIIAITPPVTANP